jgi:hypothetical protein
MVGWALAGAIVFLGVAAPTAKAQSTIFNIPSTDTVSMGKGYFEIDLLPQAPGPDQGASTMIFNPRIVIGLPMNAEFGINIPIFHNSDANPTSLAYFQPDLKVKVYNSDDAGVAAAVGFVANIPMNERDNQLSWAYFYGNVSKKVGKAGPRFTGGVFGAAGTKDDPKKVGWYGPRGGVLLGYEQPIMGPLSFVADWFSGQNNLGYFTPGVSIALPHSGLLNIGYSIGNDSVGSDAAAPKDRFAFFYYGITFP